MNDDGIAIWNSICYLSFLIIWFIVDLYIPYTYIDIYDILIY